MGYLRVGDAVKDGGDLAGSLHIHDDWMRGELAVLAHYEEQVVGEELVQLREEERAGGRGRVSQFVCVCVREREREGERER